MSEEKVNLKEKIRTKLNKYVMKFSSNIIIKSIANGMMMTLPITIVGSLFMVLKMIPNLPDFLAKICSVGVLITSNLIAVYVLLGVSFALVREMKGDTGSALILSMASYFALTPIAKFSNDGGKEIKAIALSYLGSKGIFVAMITAILVSYFFVKLSEKKISFKMPEGVPVFVTRIFEAIVPVGIIFSVVILISMGFNFTEAGNVHDYIYKLLQAPLERFGASIWSALALMFLSELLWWFGIHGSNVTASILTVLYAAPAYENMSAVASGGEAHNIINQFFLDVYKGPRALGLAVILIFLCRSKKFKSIGKVAIIPSIFGITEPMKFGIPQILNPILFIPLTLAAPLCVFIAYIATLIGFLPITSVAIPKNMPTFLTGFLAAGWKGLLIQIIQFVAVVLIYLPFMKMLDQSETKVENGREQSK